MGAEVLGCGAQRPSSTSIRWARGSRAVISCLERTGAIPGDNDLLVETTASRETL